MSEDDEFDPDLIESELFGEAMEVELQEVGLGFVEPDQDDGAKP